MLNLEQIKVEPIDPLDTCDSPSIPKQPEVSLLPLSVEPGVHFLTDEESKAEENYEKKKWDFLEYMPQSNGSVVCKRCGEVLASRTHWYRHKYKVHVSSFANPSPLFKCEHCNVFFKSRKGYMGHYATRHGTEADLVEGLQKEPETSEGEMAPTSPPLITNRKKFADKGLDWEEQRVKEEKLVADIINRVRRECEAQGAVGSRRGYSRRTTSLMNC